MHPALRKRGTTLCVSPDFFTGWGPSGVDRLEYLFSDECFEEGLLFVLLHDSMNMEIQITPHPNGATPAWIVKYLANKYGIRHHDLKAVSSLTGPIFSYRDV